MTAKAVRRPIAVSMGDPAGIGLELAAKAWLKSRSEPIPDFYLIAPQEVFEERIRQAGLDVPVSILDDPEQTSSRFADGLPLSALSVVQGVVPGKPSIRYAESVIASIRLGTADVLGGKARALVTNPISKFHLAGAGFEYPGHTEFLASLAEAEGHTAFPVMMLAAPELKVIPVTIHIPLGNVAAALSSTLIEQTVRTAVSDLKDRFGISEPRVVVCGLNPHAGENGVLGDEEKHIIAPAVDALKQEGFDITGPLSADSLFHEAVRPTYDVVIAMYHDQALIPIKTIAFDRAVNVTLGLPFIRTSPDHGTAFDIAGTGTANPASFIAALRLADEMADNLYASESDA